MVTRDPRNPFVTDRPYGVNRSKAIQLIVTGFVATVVMTAGAYVLRALGVPAPDFAALYGTLFGGRDVPVAFSGMWWLGLVWHVFTGSVVFPFIFDYLVDRQFILQGRWVKGLTYGAALWFLIQALVHPAAGDGFFSNRLPSPFFQTVASLVTWLIYGAVLDAFERVRVVHELNVTQRRAA